ncbi:segregation and condensation protein A [Dermatophilus congolensis]|uniref:segregation and condensation protein A n=1 Tax=Dermatophilus congolensis TaxID=1863 RepID=UPI001AAFC942|nr:ScpA family protein [Dermatophilus congolensis]MBO3129375.1 segregation/condensation protein A [Dermatophilus congolensis]MBO3131992.1 segregation/condensation protein A [Dermatophilus congolensis]MBO3133852.1 segregation/condensation protein A [Dermatophilus congolensis]MBO3136082.1 segregation/condensation protein A [Dermatophilus congolensis]MBO3138326.1 segregation/condensation protein A [Dermatophilus congolensis]
MGSSSRAPRESVKSGQQAPGGVLTRRERPSFEVHLDVFNGPFDLLLGLISKHKLDITEIALASVTDEFIAHIRAMQAADPNWDVDVASEFLLVAATLLDIKASRLLPTPEVEDEEDFALIEARDLLFARLLQYRAYQEMSEWIAERMGAEGRAEPRRPGVDPLVSGLVPELVLGISAERFVAVAAGAMTPKAAPVVATEHLHQPSVSVAEQAAIVAERVRDGGEVSFDDLVVDAESTLVVVARFLSLLELFRSASVDFVQDAALGVLRVRWTGEAEDACADGVVLSSFDEFEEECA